MAWKVWDEIIYSFSNFKIATVEVWEWISNLIPLLIIDVITHPCMDSGFEISLVRSSETSKNDSRTSGIHAGLVWRTTAYFWFSHKWHWLYIFQTSEWYFRTSDFYNPLARWTSALNLKFRSLGLKLIHVSKRGPKGAKFWLSVAYLQGKTREVNIGSGNGLAQNRWQASTRISDDLVTLTTMFITRGPSQ